MQVFTICEENVNTDLESGFAKSSTLVILKCKEHATTDWPKTMTFKIHATGREKEH